MCIKEMVGWAAVLAFLILPYGVLQRNSMKPNSFIRTLDQTWDVKFDEDGNFEDVGSGEEIHS